MTYENSADLGKQRQDQALSLVIRCGIGNLGTQNSANDWSPSSTDQVSGIQYLESKIQRVELSWITLHDTNLFKYAHLRGLMIPCRSPRLGSLSNYDDFRKTTGLMIKTTALHVHHAF